MRKEKENFSLVNIFREGIFFLCKSYSLPIHSYIRALGAQCMRIGYVRDSFEYNLIISERINNSKSCQGPRVQLRQKEPWVPRLMDIDLC